ncbi:potassium channel family protein [Falsiroseomonas sp. CW058]|uniref:potassium channel family protein n=1 Tax=Falsiroseomonas sp. CW058 TaxID=3388664 RepID=UPI003D31B8D1
MTRATRKRLWRWLRSVGFTLGLSLLVAWGVGDQGQLLPVFVIGVAAFGLGLLYYLFPRGLHFAFGTAVGLALYASLFVVLGHAQFPDAPDWSRPPAFLLPVIAFLGAVWWRRVELAEVAERQEAADLDHLGHTARWLVFVSLVGLVCFILPVNRLAPGAQGAALLVAMGGIAGIVARAAREVMRLLVDVALIIDEIAGRTRHVAVPAVAFLLMYALLVIVFASAYRIADSLSVHALFHDRDGPTRLSYSDALHFSVATLSTVGYGDIQPQDDGVRVLASLEVVAGQLLLLFGVAEILRSRRARVGTRREEDEDLDPAPPDGHSPPPAAPDGHGAAGARSRFRRNPASSNTSNE